MYLERDVFRALSTLAWADGEVTSDEADSLLRAARACGVDGLDLAAVEESIRTPVDLSTLGELELDADAKSFVYAVALMMARADGEVVAQEEATLEHLARHLKISPEERRAASSLPIEPEADIGHLQWIVSQLEALATDQLHSAMPLPPGNPGLPLVGETRAYVADAFAFVEERIARHGRVFRTRVLGREVAVLSGPEACTVWLDPEKIERAGAQFDHAMGLLGGRSLPTLDDEDHRHRKLQILKGFDRDALAGYMPGIQAVVQEQLDAWAARRELHAVGELKRMVLSALARNLLGMDGGAALDQLVEDYDAINAGFAAIPTDRVGNALSRASMARDRVLTFLRARVRERRLMPREDGLSRILGAHAPDGSTLGEDDAVLELHHLFVAGAVSFAELGGMMVALHNEPEVREQVAREIGAMADAEALGVDLLHRMPVLGQVVMEVKRTTPVMPLLFGKARASFAFDGYRIPAGWQVGLALTANNSAADIYAHPHIFDPGRFADGRAEHQRHLHAYTPHGPGPVTGHKCPGSDYSSCLTKVFTCLLMRGFDWSLPEQDLRLDYQKLPPEPRDGLIVRIQRRA